MTFRNESEGVFILGAGKMNLEVFRVAPQQQADCKSCGKWAIGKYRVQGVSGAFCSIACLETELFGEKSC
jgi:hypothetical protein